MMKQSKFKVFLDVLIWKEILITFQNLFKYSDQQTWWLWKLVFWGPDRPWYQPNVMVQHIFSHSLQLILVNTGATQNKMAKKYYNFSFCLKFQEHYLSQKQKPSSMLLVLNFLFAYCSYFFQANSSTVSYCKHFLFFMFTFLFAFILHKYSYEQLETVHNKINERVN